jgi:hypothetical protein
MLDKDIRRALRIRAARLHADDQDARIIEEFDLGPGARADMIILNGRIEGYEIKSDHDSLVRLRHQIGAYEAVCDRVWLVTTERFFESASVLLPAWWGILVATARNGEVSLVRRRAARAHQQQRLRSLVELLWREELVALCERYAVAAVRKRSTAPAIRDALAAGRLSRRRLADDVRQALVVREGWRAARPCASGDAPFPPAAKWSGSRSVLPPHRRR